MMVRRATHQASRYIIKIQYHVCHASTTAITSSASTMLQTQSQIAPYAEEVHASRREVEHALTVREEPPCVETRSDRQDVQYVEAQTPALLHEIANKVSNHAEHTDCTVLYHEVVILWKQCIESKILHWRNNTNLVENCFNLHQLLMKRSAIKIDFQYISLMTHILSNSKMNQPKMARFLNDLQHCGLFNVLTFEILIKSCYNEYTGDSDLAYFIYRRFESENMRATADIVNELLITCMKRGAIQTAFQMFHEVMSRCASTAVPPITDSVVLKLFDICCVKHSVFYADSLVKQLLFNKRLSHIFRNNQQNQDNCFLLNNYLKVCGVCGNLRAALNAMARFGQYGVNLKTIDLLLRTLTTNAQLYDKQSKWKGVLSKNSHLYEAQDANSVANPVWTQLITSSIDIVEPHRHVIVAQLRNPSMRQFIYKLFDRMAFFASRYERQKSKFLSVYRYLEKFEARDLELMSHSSIVGHMLRGFQSHSLFAESIKLWRYYCVRNRHREENDDEKAHPYTVMIRMCSYNMSRRQFRDLGKEICLHLAQHSNYYNQQRLFDAAFNFWSSDEENSIHFLEKREMQALDMQRSLATYCALIRCCMKNMDLQRALFYISEVLQHESVPQQNENLFRVIFKAYQHFKLHEHSLRLFKECVTKYRASKYVIKMSIMSVICTYIECERYSEILQLFLYAEDKQIYDCCVRPNTLITNDDIALLMYCCYKLHDLDAALHLMEFAMDHHLTKFSMVSYNYFIQAMMARFGQFSEVVSNAVSQLIAEDTFHCDYDNGIVNVYEMSHEIVPVVLNCFITNFVHLCSARTFRIVCCPIYGKSTTFRRDNYRLLYGEDSEYVLFTAYYHLQNRYYPPIQCKWAFGNDEILCDLTHFRHTLCAVTAT